MYTLQWGSGCSRSSVDSLPHRESSGGFDGCCPGSGRALLQHIQCRLPNCGTWKQEALSLPRSPGPLLPSLLHYLCCSSHTHNLGCKVQHQSFFASTCQRLNSLNRCELGYLQIPPHMCFDPGWVKTEIFTLKNVLVSIFLFMVT